MELQKLFLACEGLSNCRGLCVEESTWMHFHTDEDPHTQVTSFTAYALFNDASEPDGIKCLLATGIDKNNAVDNLIIRIKARSQSHE